MGELLSVSYLITADAKFYRKTNKLSFIKFIDEVYTEE